MKRAKRALFNSNRVGSDDLHSPGGQTAGISPASGSAPTSQPHSPAPVERKNHGNRFRRKTRRRVKDGHNLSGAGLNIGNVGTKFPERPAHEGVFELDLFADLVVEVNSGSFSGGSGNVCVLDKLAREAPYVVRECLGFLAESPNGTDAQPPHAELVVSADSLAADCEGLFRLSGAQLDIEELLTHFRAGRRVHIAKAPESARDPHVVAGALKKWLREDCKDALLTWELYDAFLAAAQVPEEDAQLTCLCTVVDLMPPGHRFTARLLFLFLHSLLAFGAKTKMSSHNLAIVFAPSVLRLPAHADTPATALNDSNGCATAVELLIENAPKVFALRADKSGFSKTNRQAQPVDKNNQALRSFHETLHRGTLRLAKSFIEDEGDAEEEIPSSFRERSRTVAHDDPVHKRVMGRRRASVADVFGLPDHLSKSSVRPRTPSEGGTLADFPLPSSDIPARPPPPVPDDMLGDAMDHDVMGNGVNEEDEDRVVSFDDDTMFFTLEELYERLLVGDHEIVDNYLSTMSLEDRATTVQALDAKLADALAV